MEETILKAQNGDKEALNKVIKEIEPPLYKLALLKLKNIDDAQDVVQNTLIQIYKNLKQLRKPIYFKTWTTRILINECNKHYRIKSKRIEKLDNISDELEFELKIDEVNQKIDAIKVLESLDIKEKDIMILHINGYKNSEIAEILKMKENTVKTKIRRCKDKIKKNYVFDKKEKTIIPKTLNAILSIILVILLTTGLVYASVVIVKTIQEEEEKPEPIKWANCEVEINAQNTTIMQYMNKYDNNTYYLNIKDLQKLNEMKDKLDITFGEIINNDTFEKYKYDVLILSLLNEETLVVQNVLPYKNKLTIVLTKKSEGEKRKEFCVFVPKLYNNENIEILYEEEKSKSEPPEGAIHFKHSEFYVENTEKFDKLNLKYDNEQDIYYTDFLDFNSYNVLSKDLGIVTKNDLNKDLSNKEIILIFKKTDNKLRFSNFGTREGIIHIYVKELEEKYGNGITGALVIVDKGVLDNCKVKLKD